MKFKGIHIFVGLVCLAVGSSVVAGFLTVGSPSKQRAMNLDQQRISDLQQIGYAVDSFYNQVGSQKLPASLDELRRAQNVYVNSIVDPGTQNEYGYSISDATHYQLCTTFDTAVDTTGQKGTGSEYLTPAGSTFWDHPIGHKCFDLKVNAMNIK